VSWRYSGDVVGWAPLAPGVSVYVSVTPFIDAWWTFVPCQSFVAVPVNRVAYERGFGRRYFDATAPAPARPGFRPGPGRQEVAPAWGGPPQRAIEQRIGRPIVPVRVVAAPSPGAAQMRPGEVAIYRPEVRGGQSGVRPLPPRVERSDARGFRASGNALSAPARPGAAIPPGQHRLGQPSFERSPASTPAPAIRGGEGRPAGAWHGPAAPQNAGARAERAWTSSAPETTRSPGRPELQGGGEAPRPQAQSAGRAEGGGRGTVQAPARREERKHER
jgi:hypothetical protein